MRSIALAALVTVALGAHSVRRLHFAAVAPEGSEWANELRQFSRDVARSTDGGVVIKWTLGGAGGDEPTELERVVRDELDGVAGAVMCERLAPSLRALELVGLVGNEEEAAAVLAALLPGVEDELRTTPFRALFVSMGFGHRVLFSKRPVRTMEDLERGRWFVWSLDETLATQLREMGLHIVPLPLHEAVAAADDGRVDGFIVVPSAALSFGMFTRARWFTDLHSAFLPGCMVMNAHSFARLSPPDRAAVNAAAARLKQEFESSERRVNQHLEAAFEREGLRASPMSPAFRAAFLESGRAALRRLDSRLAPATLIDETKRILERVR